MQNFIKRFMSYRGNREKKLGNNAENNTAVASTGGNKILRSIYCKSLMGYGTKGL